MDKELVVPVGDGLRLKLHKPDGKGGYREKSLHVTRGNLCLDWFKVKCGESGHYELHVGDHKGDPEHGGPKLCALSDLAKEAGWKLGPKPEPAKARPKADKKVEK